MLNVKVISCDRLNPRTEYDPTTKIWAWHKRYVLGDKEQPKEPTKPIGAIVKPLYMVDHSGLHIRTRSFSDCDPGEWDSGQIGWVFITLEDARKEWGRLTPKRKKMMEDCLEAEVREYDKYISGEPEWGYIVSNSWTTLDSCGGFDTIQEAKEALADYLLFGEAEGLVENG